jgi:hypothetical protein
MQEVIMKKIVIFIALLSVLVLSLPAEEAYNPMKFGIFGTFLNNTSSNPMFGLGAQLHITPLISVRPSVFFYDNSGKREYTYPTASTYTLDPWGKGSIFGVKFTVPIHFIQFQSGSIYAGPTIAFASQKSPSYTNNLNTSYLNYETNSTTLDIGATIGGEYLFSKNFGVFLDLGILYEKYTGDYTDYDVPSGNKVEAYTQSNTYIRTDNPTIGIIVYFN